MKEIKSYVHHSRVADVIAALKESAVWGGESGDTQHNLAVYLVRGMVTPPDGQDRRYSTDLGDEVVNEYKLELVCPDQEVDELTDIIAKAAHTGADISGWITVSELVRATPIR